MKVHKYAKALPEMTPQEFADLKADLKENGQKVPLILYNDQILDGRHRYKALRELNVSPGAMLVKPFDGTDVDAARLVISLNIKRRHLTDGQKSLLSIDTLMPAIQAAAKAAQVESGGDKKSTKVKIGVAQKSKTDPEPSSVHTDQELAKAAGVSPGSIKRALKIKKAAEQDEDAAEVLEEVRAGRKSLGAAYNEVTRKNQPPTEEANTAYANKMFSKAIREAFQYATGEAGFKATNISDHKDEITTIYRLLK